MSKFIINLYESDEGELALYQRTPGNLTLMFSGEASGYLSVGDKCYEVKDGRAVVPLADLCEGEIAPELITKSKRWALPRFVYDGRTVYPKPLDDEYVRAVSKRARILEAKIREVLAEVEKIKEKIYGKLLL